MCSNIPSPETLLSPLLLKPAIGHDATVAPQVTVVTVCFNPIADGRKEALAKNLDSVQQQRGVKLEHLIIDGASTDGTLDFLKAYNNTKHDVGIFSMADSGIYEAMNRGIALARGEYIIFLNSDDFYHRPDGLASSLKALEQSHCSFTFAPVRPEGAKRFHTHYHHPQRRLHKLFLTSVIPHPSMLYRKSALTAEGGFDTQYKLAADYDLTLRLIVDGHKARFVASCFATFVMGGFSTLSQNSALEERENISIVKNIHSKVFGVELTEMEAKHLVRKGTYPRKFLSVYLASQRLIAQAFEGLPTGLAYKLTRCFNYIKYLFRCLACSSSPDNAGRE